MFVNNVRMNLSLPFTQQKQLAQLRRWRLRAFLMGTRHYGPRNHPSVIATIPADVVGMIAQWVALSDGAFYDTDQMNN